MEHVHVESHVSVIMSMRLSVEQMESTIETNARLPVRK